MFDTNMLERRRALAREWADMLKEIERAKETSKARRPRREGV